MQGELDLCALDRSRAFCGDLLQQVEQDHGVLLLLLLLTDVILLSFEWRVILILLEHPKILQLELPDIDLPLINELPLIDPAAQLFEFELAHDLPDHVLDLVVVILFGVEVAVVVGDQLIELVFDEDDVQVL